MESKRAVNQVLSPVRPWAETRRKRGRWAGSYSSDWAAIEGPGFCFLLKIIFLAVLVLPKSSCSREVALVEYAWKLDGGWIGCNISPGGVWGAWCFMGKTRFAYKLSLEIGWHYKMEEDVSVNNVPVSSKGDMEYFNSCSLRDHYILLILTSVSIPVVKDRVGGFWRLLFVCRLV